jgi:ABC-type uncharacterized transport system ATPase subunit
MGSVNSPRIFAGLRQATGKVQVSGRDMTNVSPPQYRAGVAFIPEERLSMGVIRDFTVQARFWKRRPPLTHGVF